MSDIIKRFQRVTDESSTQMPPVRAPDLTHVSRRFFLLGSAAVVAAAAIPLIAQPETAVAQGVLASRFKFRRIESIMCGVADPYPRNDLSINWTLGRNDTVLHKVAINALSFYRWESYPGDEIVIDEHDSLRLLCEPALEGAHIALISNMEINPDKPARRFYESFTWKGDKFELDGPFALNAEDVDWAQEAA